MSGAPFAYKTTNISVLGLFAGNGSLENVLAANNPDRPIVDFDRVNDRADVRLAGVRVACVELFGHEPRESVNLPGVDCGRRTALSASVIKSRFCALPLGLQRRGAFPQDFVEFYDAVLD
ncbi:hypothetical protein [Bradyrhizobium japonicum]|uniref:hypothetical protein n=1 Tax=Bradyrhizobium japonicum TaxID=375 RepID=UPI000462E46A|nr:hypothetical protein [Bradyrhizobium japonicum]